MRSIAVNNPAVNNPATSMAAASMARIQRLKGRAEAVRSDAIRLEKSVGIAKARQDIKEDVEGVLDDLERRFHERSMGILESLLGAFLNDVLPRDQDMGEQSVQMSLDTQRGLPALQVAVRNGEQVEDALRGRGGSVANVLSAGLRFIAIARTGGRANTLQGVRPFLVLDEADCWLSPDRVPAFSDVIHSLTYDLGVQVLMISHHDTDLLKGFPVHLERVVGKDGMPAARVRHTLVQSEVKLSERSDAEDAENEKLSEDHYTRLTGIRLENFLSHVDSLIPLVAGVTVLTGDNDVGKSAVTEAFRAIAYNDSSDAVIRHGASEARVTLLFADGTGITWVRVRKGSPKTSYRLFDAHIAGGDTIRETPAPKEVPEWVRLMLGMDLREKMDVHIGNQKSPIFLLDQPPSQRAAILDIGRESQHLRTLRERWKHQVDEDRRTIREGEKQLAFCRRSLAVLSALEEVEEDCRLYAAVAGRSTAQLEALMKHQAQCDRSAVLQASLRLFSEIPQLPELPALSVAITIKEGVRWVDAARHLRRTMDTVGAVGTIGIPDLPDLRQLTEGAQWFHRAVPLRAALRALKSHNHFLLPDLPESMDKLAHGMALNDRSIAARERLNVLKGWDEDSSGFSIEDLPVEGLRVTAIRMVDGYKMGKQSVGIRKALSMASIELDCVTKEHDLIEKEYQERLQAFGACPFCGSTTHNKEHH